MKKILILEDQYARVIYKDLQKNANYEFPIVDNIQNPMKYKKLFKDADVILLDNYFPGLDGGREEPLWVKVLEYLLEKNITTLVICISDYKEALLEKYPVRERAFSRWIVKWFPSKDTQKIYKVLENI